jgi:hypothetical protein
MQFPFQPMPLSRRAQPFNHPEWVFEIKHDGFRALAYVSDGKCQLVSRKSYVYKRFVSLAVVSARCSPLPTGGQLEDVMPFRVTGGRAFFRKANGRVGEGQRLLLAAQL